MLWWFISALAAPCEGFTGPFAPENWSTTGIQGGTAEIDLAQSSAEQLVFVYDVNYGVSGGVDYREVRYVVDVPDAVEWNLRWDYSLNHAWFQAAATLAAFSSPGGASWLVDEDTSGQADFGGDLVGWALPAGGVAGIQVGAENFDSNSFVGGSVTLSQLSFEHASCDCAGVYEGLAELDDCDVCDDDPNNDCIVDSGDSGRDTGSVGPTGTTPTADTASTNPADTGGVVDSPRPLGGEGPSDPRHDTAEPADGDAALVGEVVPAAGCSCSVTGVGGIGLPWGAAALVFAWVRRPRGSRRPALRGDQAQRP